MSDWPILAPPTSPILSPWSRECIGYAVPAGQIGSLVGASSAAYPTANLALFYPFRIVTPSTVRQMLWFVGGVSSGNIDVGIYDREGHLIVSSTSTAMSATINTWQELNITDTPLPAGAYWLAGACDNTTGTVICRTSVDELALSVYPIYEQATAFPLPSTATPVLSTATTVFMIAIAAQFSTVF